MNSENLKIYYNFISFAGLLFILMPLQTSLWPHFFGIHTSPHVFIPFLLYATFYKELRSGFCLLVVFSFVLTGFTWIPIQILFLSLFTLFGMGIFLKSRIHWSGIWPFALGSWADGFEFSCSSFFSQSNYC